MFENVGHFSALYLFIAQLHSIVHVCKRLHPRHMAQCTPLPSRDNPVLRTSHKFLEEPGSCIPFKYGSLNSKCKSSH